MTQKAANKRRVAYDNGDLLEPGTQSPPIPARTKGRANEVITVRQTSQQTAIGERRAHGQINKLPLG